MIASGATANDVQRALGHKSAVMTLDLYAGHFDKALDGVASRMDGLLDASLGAPYELAQRQPEGCTDVRELAHVRHARSGL